MSEPLSSLPRKLLVVGDDNFTVTPCIKENLAQWKSKCGSPDDEIWVIEVASCLPENKIPFVYQMSRDKLVGEGTKIHYSVNPALLRQYFPAAASTTDNSNPGGAGTGEGGGPPYDYVLYILPGLQYEGAPRFIEKTSDLFQLRLHLYWFALCKSATVITKPGGALLFLWLDQESPNVEKLEQPFPLLDIHKLGPFCKVRRSQREDFRLNLSWGEYKNCWRPLVHNVELISFPTYLDNLKVYVFRNLPPETSQIPQNAEDYNLLRIPQSICQWNRTVLPHVNELFHFSMRTCVPGEMLLISKLSVKYDPRINGWRNAGNPAPLQRTGNGIPEQQLFAPPPVATAGGTGAGAAPPPTYAIPPPSYMIPAPIAPAAAAAAQAPAAPRPAFLAPSYAANAGLANSYLPTAAGGTEEKNPAGQSSAYSDYTSTYGPKAKRSVGASYGSWFEELPEPPTTEGDNSSFRVPRSYAPSETTDGPPQQSNNGRGRQRRHGRPY